MRPVDAVTLEQAARILGCSRSTVSCYVLVELSARGSRYGHRTLSRADVEALAVEVYPWRRHLDDRDAYWLTGQRAADVLGVNRATLRQLGDVDRVPFVVHRDGTRLYRRDQLEVVAQARDAMWH